MVCTRYTLESIMNTSVINIKTNPEVKASAQRVANDLGFSLSALINGYLKQLVKTKTAHFSLNENAPSEYMLNALRESERDVKSGRRRKFANSKSAVSFLDKLINEGDKN